jgi:hypothetical protein
VLCNKGINLKINTIQRTFSFLTNCTLDNRCVHVDYFACPLRGAESMAGLGFAVGTHGLPSPGFSDLGNDFSGQPTAYDSMVSGGVVGDQSKEPRQRHGLTARAGLEELQGSLDLAA